MDISDYEERNRRQCAAEAIEPGSTVRSGDTIGCWEKGDHPYGQADPCPFCGETQDYTSFWYNGPGSPPSYTFTCGDCGAMGPHSMGDGHGDHVGARRDAIAQWNQRLLPKPTEGKRDVSASDPSQVDTATLFRSAQRDLARVSTLMWDAYEVLCEAKATMTELERRNPPNSTAPKT